MAPQPERPSKKPRSSNVTAPKQFSISSFLPKLAPPPPQADFYTLPPAPSSSNSSSGSKPMVKSAVKKLVPPKIGAVASGSNGKGKGKESGGKSEAEEENQEEVLWIDKYAPTNRDELGVHTRKVTDVSNWLSEAFNPILAKYRRILILSGPSGSAKTTTLKILTDEEGIEVLQYRNGSNHDFAGKESMMNQFTEFLSRAGMAPALKLGPDPSFPSTSTSSPRTPSLPALPTSSFNKRLILLEDLPNVSHYPTKLALRSALLQYLSSPRVTCPLVIIISEALNRPGLGHEAESLMGEGKGDNVDARNVCGSDVMNSPGCREIQFNPIAVTIMKKALIKVLDKVHPSSSSSRPSASTLEQIIHHSNGDIRSALMSLEFLSSNPPVGVKGVTNLSGDVKKGKKRKSAGDDSEGDQVKKLLQFVTARENSLFIFHALGKVLYSKRWGIDEDDDKKDSKRLGLAPDIPTPRLPKHLRAQWSRETSKVNPDVLFAEAPVDSDVFVSYLHHNYTAFTNTIEECCRIIDGLSTADALMRREGEDWLRRAPLTSQYSFNVAVRTTLISLPSPVPRRKQVVRKSELWERLKLQSKNAEGVDDMYKRRIEGVAGGVEGGTMRSRTSLVKEVIPWLGVIERQKKKIAPLDRKSKFWLDLATFPPVPAEDFVAAIKGEALGEKDVEEDAEDEEDEEDEDADQVDDGEEELAELDGVKEEEVSWFQTEDDIQD